MSAVTAVITSSLEKLFPEVEPRAMDTAGLSCLANEPFSFGVAYKLSPTYANAMGIYVRVECALPVSLYSVRHVPVPETLDARPTDVYRPGLFGDILIPKTTNAPLTAARYPWPEEFTVEAGDAPLFARSQSWEALYLTVNEAEKPLPAGRYPLSVKFHASKGGALLGECSLTLTVIGARLPKQRLKYTSWFHCDSLCDAYGVAPFSERFFEIFESYVRVGARHGMNVLFTPCFTPPLDTPVGGERMTVQLVGVTRVRGRCRFDFSLLDRYMDIALKAGVEYFEHSHLFTQWGAKHAPKIVGKVGGREVRLFGWETDVTDEEYGRFLRAYLEALLSHLKDKGLDHRFIFHISDEPGPATHENYKRAKEMLGGLLDGYTVGDALSHYEYYADGTVDLPIVCTDKIADFYGKAKPMWAYYTGDQCYDGLSNRKLNSSGERCRMLGVQMYMHGIEGFLHWGYNYWYGVLSQGFTNPLLDACGYNGTNAGTAYLVYPALDGTCLPSIRQKVFYEAINDMRALLLYERLAGKRAARALCESFFGEVTFFTHPESAEKLLAFRRALNGRIAEKLST
ncbi:MAG: DUF4091 domain-containing protein [Clostridia bacterium]|nr:DUF4091 domain-containing protein [Clostridia bacterium]